MEAVHDLHVWTITTGFPALSCQVVVSPRARGELLSDLGRMLKDRFGIAHTTIQVEPPDFEPCGGGENRVGDGGR